MAPNMFDKMPQRNCPRIMLVLAYAFLEWILILLLFLSSFLSFIVVKFAAYFGLKPFCSFCSRLDLIWGSKGIPNLHLVHVCEAHGAEISSLGYCFTHRRLAGAKFLCGDCLLTDGMMSGTPFRDPISTEDGGGNRCSCCREVCDPSIGVKPCWKVEASTAEVIDAEMDGEEASATVTDQSNSCSQGDQMKHDGEQSTDFEECKYPFWRPEWNGGEDESIYVTDMILQNEDYVDPDEFICIELLDTENKPSTSCWEDTEEARLELDKQLASSHKDQTEDAALLSTHSVKGLDSEKGKAEGEGIEGKQSEMIRESALKLHKNPIIDEKVEAGSEDALEGGVESEIELEHISSTEDHLKLKVSAQNKALNALYKELDEERKAAAVAANETMAMITKLQEEKAVVRMEALQYERMMEEQAEYDQEALQLLNDLMMKREKEKQELEIELEMYRAKVLEYEAREKNFFRSQKESCTVLNLEGEGDDAGLDIHHQLNSDEDLEAEEERFASITDSTLPNISLAEFDEERISILEEFKGLEAKLLAMYNNEMQRTGDIKCTSQRSLNSPTDDLMTKKPLQLFTDSETELSGETSRFIILQDELGHVYERLQALEADKEFLIHCIRSMKKGDEGLTLLHEILQHLRGLRSIEFLPCVETNSSGMPLENSVSVFSPAMSE